MNYDIVETSLCVALHGFRSGTDGQSASIVGKRLMDAMWKEIQSYNIKTMGLNHWVYLPNSEMFVGVELATGTQNGLGELEAYAVKLMRYLKFVHHGSYSTIPEIWPKLIARLKELGEISVFPNLEIYGHWNPDPDKCETTIIIGLAPKE